MQYLLVAATLIALSYEGVIEDHIPSEIGKERHSSFRLVEDESVNQLKSISKRSVANYVYGTFARVVWKIQNYPYSINRSSSPYYHYPSQNDVSPSLFNRIVEFFKRGIRRMFNGYTQIIDAQDPKLIQNYPYNINRCSSPYYHYPCQDDNNPSLFKRIVGFLKGGIETMLNGYTQIRRQGFTGVSTQAIAGVVGFGAVVASQRENIGSFIAFVIESLEPRTTDVVTEVVTTPAIVRNGIWNDDACTMEKVLRRSGKFSNEGVVHGLQFGLASPEDCNDENMVTKRCQKLSNNFYKNFRTLEGQCNNEANPLLGSSGSQLARLLPADHEKFRRQTFFDKPQNLGCPEDDCDNACQIESDMLPNVRKLSTQFSEDMDLEDSNLNLMVVFFGQFLDHELSLSPEHEIEESCCETPANGQTKDPECFEILLPPDDPFYSSLNQNCLHLTRSEPHPSSGWPPGIEREQQDIITSFLDGSNVYGSTTQRSKRVRSMVRGKLKVLDVHNTLPEENFQRCSVPIAGDERAMENPMLGSVHALFVREHNRICDQLWTLIDWTQYGNPECDNDECDELLYQNVRRVLIAEWQSINYNEWLPLIIGESRMSEFNLKLDSVSNYDNTIDPSILVSFTTAAFRFGHSMISGMFAKNNITNGNSVKRVVLSDSFFDADEYREDGMEMVLAGLLSERAQQMDRFVSSELTNFLFKNTDGPSIAQFGQDLISRNIARGRDHGLQGYAKFYETFGPQTDPNRFMRCWDERPQAFDETEWNLMKEIYIHPKDIDLFVGGLLEKRTPNEGILGPMFGYLMGEQFRRLKDGDRFFFTHEGSDHSLSSSFINSVKTRRLSDILCDNTSIRNVNTNAFLSTSITMDCSQRNSLRFEDINLLLPPSS